MENLTFITKAWTENTGGNIMIDFIELNDGRVIAISEDSTGIYKDMIHFDNGTPMFFAVNPA